jgi:hypothetical protein
MRAINKAIEAEPKRHFTFAELAALAYGSPIERTHLNAVQRAVGSLVSAKRVALGARRVERDYPARAIWVCTVRTFDPAAASSASIANVGLEQSAA